MEQNYLRWQDRCPPKGSFAVDERTVSPYALHAHDYYEMELILEGSGRQTINGASMELARGVVYLLSPGDYHEIVEAQDIRLYNIIFDESFIAAAELQTLFGTLPFCAQIPEERHERLFGAVALLAGEDSHRLGYPLMEYILRLCACGQGDPQPITPLHRAVLYVENHFREDPSLADAARVACLSPVYFGSRFREHTGKTYVEYLNGCKLSCAKMLLREGMSVTEACFGAGFGSLSGFLYVFKRVEGMTPAAYQKMVRR